jgi:hypothetical protein
MRSRLTFANLFALAVLFIVLTGGVYAAAKINGNKIKKESIAGNRLKPNGVTGQQVDESSLGRVPSTQSADGVQNAQRAQTAQTVQSAASAQTLGGRGPDGFVSPADSKRIRYDVTTSGFQGPETVLELGSLRLTASCERREFGGFFFGRFLLEATSTAQSARLDVGYTFAASPTTGGGALGTAVTTPLLVAGVVAAGDRAVGNIIYTEFSGPAAETITIPFVIFVDDTARCLFSGRATRVAG